MVNSMRIIKLRPPEIQGALAMPVKPEQMRVNARVWDAGLMLRLT